jgi:hypothetical protein
MVDDTEILVVAETMITPADYAVAVGDWVQVKAIQKEGQALVAQEIQVSLGAIETRTTEFVGTIERISGKELVIADTSVVQDAETAVSGELVVGNVAYVYGILQTDRSVLARQIEADPPQVRSQSVQLENVIVDMQPEWWWLGDAERPETWIKVWTTDAEIPTPGHVGLFAEVTGYRREDGSVDATLIQVQELDPFDEIRFSGIVSQMDKQSWVIQTDSSPKTIVIDTNTFIDESKAPALVGNRAHVTAIPETMVALRISMTRPD